MPAPRSFLFVALTSSLSFAAAQAVPWAQCGGIGYAGPTTCVPLHSCIFLNECQLRSRIRTRTRIYNLTFPLRSQTTVNASL
ncbi:hypothetical protein BDZ94DRAFT_1254703 [Collybia nuda]|uniref:CBM1 domain-containing protein n=1 Tax=Collybia nuda TaxID=64659 RepID=A0A9P6CGK6_9AGAR|nr:hypothetical protein BDZ94DRAFT_1254703 [Collybia nuda]